MDACSERVSFARWSVPFSSSRWSGSGAAAASPVGPRPVCGGAARPAARPTRATAAVVASAASVAQRDRVHGRRGPTGTCSNGSARTRRAVVRGAGPNLLRRQWDRRPVCTASGASASTGSCACAAGAGSPVVAVAPPTVASPDSLVRRPAMRTGRRSCRRAARLIKRVARAHLQRRSRLRRSARGRGAHLPELRRLGGTCCVGAVCQPGGACMGAMGGVGGTAQRAVEAGRCAVAGRYGNGTQRDLQRRFVCADGADGGAATCVGCGGSAALLRRRDVRHRAVCGGGGAASRVPARPAAARARPAARRRRRDRSGVRHRLRLRQRRRRRGDDVPPCGTTASLLRQGAIATRTCNAV